MLGVTFQTADSTNFPSIMPQWELNVNHPMFNDTVLMNLFSGEHALTNPQTFGAVIQGLMADIYDSGSFCATIYADQYGFDPSNCAVFVPAMANYMGGLVGGMPGFFTALGYGPFRTMSVHDYFFHHIDILSGGDVSFLTDKTGVADPEAYDVSGM